MHRCLRFLVPVLLTCAILAPAADFSTDPPSELASALAKKAKRAAKAGDADNAYVYYSQASALQPKNRGYRSKMNALQAHGAGQIAQVSASVSNETSEVVLPETFDSITAREYANDRQLASPPRLNAAPGRFDFNFNGQPRDLFRQMAARFNLLVVFDGDYPQSGAPVRFHVDQMDYRDALTALQAATGSFVIPISPRVFMVARDTVAKRNDLEQYVTLTLRVPQVRSAQELTEVVQIVRQATNVEKIGWDTANNQIVIRDRVSRAAPAQALLAQLISYQPQVMVDLELLQVSDDDLSNYGLRFSDNLAMVYLGGVMRSVATIPTGVTSLLAFGGGRTLIGIAAMQVQAMFNETISTSRALYSGRLRTAGGTMGTFHVGEKYPIITSGFVGTTSSSANASSAFLGTPAVSYEDLGLEIKVTPRIHGPSADGTAGVTMTIDATYEVLTGQSADGIPVIGRNHIATDIRVRNEEWAIVGGLTNQSDSKGHTGLWGLASLPWVGNIFRQTSTDHGKSNLLIGIRPHILSLPPDEGVTQALRVGSEARPYIPL